MSFERWHSLSRIGPKPDDLVEQCLWRFAGLAGPNASHPLDWQRFYEFVVLAHSRRKGWDYVDVQGRLRRYGFEERVGRELAEAYWHGRCALYVRARGGRARDHVAWIRRGGSCLT
jgi:hypothetical protein